MDVYEYDEGDEGGRSPVRILATLVVIAALAAAGWFVVKPRLTNNDDAATPPAGATVTTTAAADTEDETTAESTDRSVETAGGTATSTTSPTSSSPAASSTTPTPTPTTSVETPTSVEITTTNPPAPTTTVPPASSTPASTAAAIYPTLPDGSPEPVIATFDVGRVILTGSVPDEAAKERLGSLALANSRDPTNTVVENQLLINPAVPRGVGVRVIELTSTRFPEGSAEILLLHAAELNRVKTVMDLLPNVSVLIVGHADQRGEDQTNFVISDARARAVFDYLVGQGVAPSRLSSRAVGEADLLSINDDAASLALNRRTEFIFYGLLIP